MSLTARQWKAIDQAKERLVLAAEELLEEAQVTKFAFGHSQLRNLIAVASETDSPKVVVNFIRYQMGRDNYRNNWFKPDGQGKTLGQRFIDDLDGSEGAVSKAFETIPEVRDDAGRQLVRIELTRQFLGFASRHLKYLDLLRKFEGGEDR